MKLQVFSDLHIDAREPVGSGHGVRRPPRMPIVSAQADVVVCAGDVCQGLRAAMLLLRLGVPHPTPIVTVAGNHSFYGGVMDAERQAGRAAARAHAVTLLEDEAAVIGGVRFVGATLWTDYALYGDPDAAMDRAAREMNDHRLIAWSDGVRFTPEHALRLHMRSVRAITALLSEPFDGPTVVVTHHAPSERSVEARYRSNPLNPAFCSNLEALIAEHRPVAWVHGHMHGSADYRVGRTRVVNNPLGYGRENERGFDPGLILDVCEEAGARHEKRSPGGA